MMRRIFRCLERPSTDGLSAQDTWCEPVGHPVKFCYLSFGGHWGTWHYLYLSENGPKEWVFKPFVDEQAMIGGKGRMIYKQHHQPQGAVTGSVWLCPLGSFKRVLSRGGAWENVNLGSTHPDEKDHEDEQESSAQPEAVTGDDSAEVPSGAGESTSGNGDDGETVSEPSGERGSQDSVLDPPEGEGVDGNGSPVV